MSERKRVLSGIQPTGSLHLGNYYGAMKQHIELQNDNECFYFIANYHALTSNPAPEDLARHSLDVAMDYMALGLDTEKTVFWRQSDVPEVTELMNVLYRSMDAVSPRMVPNLEVNDKLGAVLEQLTDKKAPPPMMYDFHLPCVVPLVFNTGSTTVLPRIFALIDSYDIPRTSIRFSLAESHDGKSVRGSMDLLSLGERQSLADVVEANGGRIKYKSAPSGQCDRGEFEEVCRDAGIDASRARAVLFEPPSGSSAGGTLYLRPELRDAASIHEALGLDAEHVHQIIEQLHDF